MDKNQKAIQTREALQHRFGIKDESKLYYRLEDLHDITWSLVNATTDLEKKELIEKLKEWYKLCDW